MRRGAPSVAACISNPQKLFIVIGGRMRSISKKGKFFLAGAIFLALVFIAAVVMFIVSCVKAEQTSELGYDINQENVLRISVDEEGNRIAGTQEGKLFAFNEDGELLWDVGQVDSTQVFDIKVKDGMVYAAYASGKIYSFSEADALAFYGRANEPAPAAEDGEPEQAETESFSQFCTVYSAGKANLSTNAKSYNTEILLGDGEFWFRAPFNDGSNRYYLYRFTVGSGEYEQICRSPSSNSISGMALCGGTFYYSRANGVFCGEKQLYSWEGEIVALSASSEELSILTKDGQLIALDPQSGAELYRGAVGVEGDAFFSTGENFLVKVKNGGVAFIGSAERNIILSLSASNDSDFILWNDDCFALRDRGDIEHPSVIFYTFSVARSVALFGTLRWVFLGVSLAAVIGLVICAFSVQDTGRRKLAAQTKSFAKDVWKNKSIYIALVIPFVLLIIFYYIPIVLGFSISFMDYVPGVRSVFEGFRYYGAVFRSAVFWESTGHMVILLIADLLKALIPPFIIAELIFAVKLKRFSLWVRILLFLPGILPGVATTLVWQEGIFGSDLGSGLNAIIHAIVPSFVAKNWLFDNVPLALFSIICFGFPWVGAYLIFYGALGGINTSVFEAAKLDGCSWIRRVIRIDIPMILSQFKYVLITSFIASVQNYGTLYIVYNGQSDTALLKTPALLMYDRISGAQYGAASVMGVFLFLILAAATFFNFRSQKEQLD